MVSCYDVSAEPAGRFKSVQFDLTKGTQTQEFVRFWYSLLSLILSKKSTRGGYGWSKHSPMAHITPLDTTILTAVGPCEIWAHIAPLRFNWWLWIATAEDRNPEKKLLRCDFFCSTRIFRGRKEAKRTSFG